MVVYSRELAKRRQETRDTRHFAATRSVKRSEASPLASGGCWLPFCRPPTSSRHPLVRSRLTAPGHLSAPPVSLTECAIAFPIPRASASARPPPRVESSRATSRPIPPQSQPFSVPSSAATSRHSARTAALKYPPSPARPIPTQLVPSQPNPSHPERPTIPELTPAHGFADISRR